MKVFLPVACLILTLAACNNSSDKKKDEKDTTIVTVPEDTTSTEQNDSKTLVERAKTVITLLKEKNFMDLRALVSPRYGVKFSTDGMISTNDIGFNREQLATIWTDTKEYVFPSFNEEINKKTFKEYYETDIYDRDYITATETEPNKYRRGPTPGLFDLKPVYPDASFVDFFIPPPPNKPDEELNWATLRLVFVKENGEWFLRHIVRDNWTP